MRHDKVNRSTKGLSVSQWNGFIDMHKDFYGLSSAGPVPDAVRNSLVCIATTDEESIPAYSPVRLEYNHNFDQNIEGSPSYHAKAVTADDGPESPTYGFTLGEGLTAENGGRVVVSGLAIVELTRDQLYDGSLLSNSYTGEFDSTWYNVPDKTICDDATILIGPVGHFKLLSWYRPTELQEEIEEATDPVYVLLDMNQRPSGITVKLDSSIPAATGGATDRVLNCGPAKVLQVRDGSTTGTDIYLEENSSGFEINVYNPTDGELEAGYHAAVWSETLNGFLITVGAGGAFTVHLDKTGGERGSSTQQCSWIYDVRAWGSDAIIKSEVDLNKSPHEARRPYLGGFRPATSGQAIYDSNGDLTILSTNEVWEVSTC